MSTTDLLAKSLTSSLCIISVMGDHAGESESKIFRRKMVDIATVGQTFWLARSYKSRPDSVKKMNFGGEGYVIFIAPSEPGGAAPTKTSDRVTEYSVNRKKWIVLSPGLGPVTGKLGDTCFALVFDKLELVSDCQIDIWTYAEFKSPDVPLKFKLGCSTICAIRKDMSGNAARMKRQFRSVVAVARLADPHCVWVR